MDRVNSFAVLGAGNGGQAMAAYLALQGYKVNLYNRSEERIEAAKKTGGITLSGVFTGFGKLQSITTNLAKALENSEIIMVVTPAVAHKFIARMASPLLKDGQIIVLNPGRTGGALEFYNTLKENKCKADVIISETQTFIYASRIIGPAQARIYGVKNKVAIATFPSLRVREVVDKLMPIFPQFTPVENVLKTSMDNIGAIFHPAPTLLNMAWIESTGGSFNYYQQGISLSVARVLEKLDEERMEVAKALGVEPTSARDWLRMSYGARGHNLFELLQNNGQYSDISAPPDINTRYIFEDVPMSLVPISSIGQKLGIETPTIDMIIDLACIVHETDYRMFGRTVENLGIEDLSVQEINRLVNIGDVRNRHSINEIGKSILNNIKDIDILINDYEKDIEGKYYKEGGID